MTKFEDDPRYDPALDAIVLGSDNTHMWIVFDDGDTYLDIIEEPWLTT